jgi:TRAP-type C4-dicarboxylate transport system permease small subunit
MPGGPARIFDSLHRLEETVISLLLLVMILLTCVQVVLRGFFSSGLDWADSLLRYLVLWGGLLGAGVATSQGKHITIDLASHLLPKRWLRRLRVILDLFSALVCAILTWAAVVFVKNEAAFGGDASTLGLTYWQLNLIFPIVFTLMTVRFLILAGKTIRGRRMTPKVKP